MRAKSCAMGVIAASMLSPATGLMQSDALTFVLCLVGSLDF